MRKLSIIIVTVFCSLCAMSQTMKMVVDKDGEPVGRFVRENANTFTIDVQDTAEVPKEGLKVVTFKAVNGEGYVFRDQKRVGNINVRKGPSTQTTVIAKIADTSGSLPEVYPCLGLVKGWYKILIDKKIGYVRSDLMCWDGMVTF